MLNKQSIRGKVQIFMNQVLVEDKETIIKILREALKGKKVNEILLVDVSLKSKETKLDN